MESDLQPYLTPLSADRATQAGDAASARMAIESELQQSKVDWVRVEQQARKGLEKTRSLHLGLALVVCLARKRGPLGLRDGLELLRRWTSDLWSQLLPELDSEETDAKDKALRRLRLLKAIGSTNTADPFRFLSHVLDMPVFEESRMTFGLFSPVGRGPGEVIGAGLIEAWEGARQRDPESLAMVEPALEGCLTELEELSKALAEHLGGDPGFLSPTGSTPTTPGPWDLLRNQLKDFHRQVCLLSKASSASTSPPSVQDGIAGKAAGTPVFAYTTRVEAMDALREAAAYFQREEPSSPVLFLLRYAVEVGNQSFLSLYQNWASKKFDDLKDKLGLDKDTLKSLSTSVSLQAQPEIAQKAEIVETRDKAIEVLRVVLRFFQEHDRSNPVPTILNQALELSRLSFGEIWDRYAPEEVAAIRLQLGASRPEKGPST